MDKTKRKLLLVDDDKDCCSLTSLYLEQEFDVVVANDGLDAIKKLDKSISVVLTDIDMPVKNGYELIAWVRSQKEYVNLPIIACSAHTNSNAIEKIFASGTDVFCRKPITRNMLKESLCELSKISKHKFHSHSLGKSPILMPRH